MNIQHATKVDYYMMKRYGLIGFPLEHSFSRNYFKRKFVNENIRDCEYNNYPLRSLSLLRNLFEEDNSIVGINVTIPYKKDIIGFLDSLDKTAEETGSVNVVKIVRPDENRYVLRGYNTDWYGFKNSLPDDILKRKGEAIVLGTGGASASVVYVLRTLDYKVTILSRSRGVGVIAYYDLPDNCISEADLIVNTTPLGMYPSTDTMPELNYNMLSESHFLYDLVYNPELTLFLKEGIARGCRVKNGLEMLALQADRAWELWNDTSV